MEDTRAVRRSNAHCEIAGRYECSTTLFDKVIAKINYLFSSKDWLEESETLQQQAHNNTLTQFSTPSLDLQNEFVGAAIGAMDSHTDLSTQILNTPDLSKKLSAELVPIIYKGLKASS